MRVLRLAARLWIALLLLYALLTAALLIARLVVLPRVSDQPRLVAAEPPDGVAGVSPRASVSLRFSSPMNTPSVERSLRVEPPLPARLLWDVPRTTLTISPTAGLAPDTTYRVTVAGDALGRLFGPLAAPASVSFRTAPAPAVVAVSPADRASDVRLTSPVSLRFSRPIVDEAATLRSTSLPALRFDPPLPGSVIWLDQRTALFRPDAPMRPGTRYTATLDPSLADLAGGTLGRAYTWSFATPAARVVAASPPPGGRLAGPRTPLTLMLSHPLDTAVLSAGLALTPAHPGALASALLPGGTQVITFTPAADWQSGTTYQAALEPTSGEGQRLPLAEPFRWSFSAPPRPALVGRFPGEGQTLPAGREVRLIFSTPMDAEQLRAAIQFSPPAGEVEVLAGDTEVRVAADLRAATLYTVTLPADLTDRAGVPLGREYHLRLVTAPAEPALSLAEARGGLVYVRPGAPAALLVRRTNLSGLTLDLYRLDAATLVRALAFREADWASFQPERYGQAVARSWTVELADPLNAVAESRVEVAGADGALPAGSYYLRVRSPEGLRADALLLASRTRLALQSAQGAVLVQATDVISGTALANVPLALYQGGALVQEGVSGPDGVWRAQAPESTQPYIVYAASDQPAVASGGGEPAPETHRLFLMTSRLAYLPGGRVPLAGFVRHAVTQTLGLPPPGLRVAVAARRAPGAETIGSTTLVVRGGGLFSGEMTLDQAAPPGDYQLTAAVDGTTYTLPLTVLPAVSQPLAVSVLQVDPGGAAVQVLTPEGLPVAGATVSWTLSAELAPLADVEGFRFGDDEVGVGSPVAMRAGEGVTARDGRLVLGAGDLPVAFKAPLRYHITARVAEPAGPSTVVEETVLAPSDQVFVGLRLPSRIAAAARPALFELIAVDAAGRALPGAPLRLEVYRRAWEAVPVAAGAGQLQRRDELARALEVTAGPDGRAQIELALTAGEYRLRAMTEEEQPTTAAASLWVTRPGYADWGPPLSKRPLLVADRESYRPGETATLLLTAPAEEGTLVTFARAGEITGTLRAIRAGVPFTVTLTEEDAPGLRVAALLPGARDAGQSPSGLVAPPVAEVMLPVARAARVLEVTLESDARQYVPGGTAALTITTTLDGLPVPASVVLAVAPPYLVYTGQVAAALELGGSVRAEVEPTCTAPACHPGAAHGSIWNPVLRTGPDGVLSVEVRLPDDPGPLRAVVWAAERVAAGQAALELDVGPPVLLRQIAPPFLRAGDSAAIGAELASTDAVSQELTVSMGVRGAALAAGTSAARQVTLEAGGEARLNWGVEARGDALAAELRLEVGGADGSAAHQVGVPILPPETVAVTAGGALVEGRHAAALDLPDAPRAGWGRLDVEVVPSSAALLRQAADVLAATPDRTTLDEAGLLLITVRLSDTATLAGEAAVRLVDLQNRDGGWGWWPGAPSHLFPTAVALEALAAARDADLPQELPVEKGLAALRAFTAGEAVRAPLRAYALFVESRYGPVDNAALTQLAADPVALGPDGLAFLLLARSPDEARAERNVLIRLESLARREPSGTRWSAPVDASLPQTDVALTALAALALEHAQPDSPLAAEGLRWIAAQRPVRGWPGGYESARAVIALASALPTTPAEYTVRLGADRLLAGGVSDTGPGDVALALADLPDAPTLDVLSAGRVLISYRVTLPAGDQAPAGDDSLLREYLDPLSGERLEEGALRAGQLVRVRLTLVTGGARAFASVEEPLPAGLTLVDPGQGGWGHVARRGDRLVLTSALLAPGVHEHSYLVRASLPGRYAAPAPLARGPGGAIIGAGRGVELTVIGP